MHGLEAGRKYGQESTNVSIFFGQRLSKGEKTCYNNQKRAANAAFGCFSRCGPRLFLETDLDVCVNSQSGGPSAKGPRGMGGRIRMKQLAQGALAENDLAEELPQGKTVNFPGEIRQANGRIADETDSWANRAEDDRAEDERPAGDADLPAEGVSRVESAEDERAPASDAEIPPETEEPGDREKAENGEEDSETAAPEFGAESDAKSGGFSDVADAQSETAVKEAYFGSVKFFKNIILMAVVIAIVLPTVMAACFWRQGRAAVAALEGQRAALSGSLAELQTRYDRMAEDKLAEERVWGGSVADQVVKAVPLDYQKLYPDFYVKDPLGPTVQDDGTMYLTFDDGPSSNTPLLLSILRNKDVKATFFVVGGDTEKQRQWMRDIVADGHTLGMHSYTHNYHQIYASVEAFLDDYYKLFTNIKEATGQTPTIFRFPGGSVNSYDYPVYREIVAEMLRRGFVFYDWNLSSGDASSNYISPKRITANILDRAPAFARGIVLFHDAPSKDSTVESLSGVIDGLRDQGFTFARLTREVRPMLFNYTDYQPD